MEAKFTVRNNRLNKSLRQFCLGLDFSCLATSYVAGAAVKIQDDKEKLYATSPSCPYYSPAYVPKHVGISNSNHSTVVGFLVMSSWA